MGFIAMMVRKTEEIMDLGLPSVAVKKKFLADLLHPGVAASHSYSL